MSGPSKSGVFIYSENIHALSDFYVQVINGSRIAFSNHEMNVIDVPENQLVIHALEPGIRINSDDRTVYRESAIKPFFTVENMYAAQKLILELGGYAEQMIYRGPYFNVCNVSDPEGNVFMIREFF